MSSYWDNYWQQGHITSFGTDIQGNYDGTLKDVWQSLFSSLGEGEVLDLCCGNGALALLADESNEALRVTGVDSAALPITSVGKRKHELMAQINCENLPFSSERFDAVISQFGVEYTKLDKTLMEVKRVLKLNGTLQFVCHVGDSVIVMPNKRILDCLDELFEENGFIDLITSTMEDSDSLNKLGAKLYHTYREALTATELPQFFAYYSRLTADSERKKAVELFKKEAQGQRARLKDLCEAALSVNEIEYVLQTLNELGFANIETREIFHEKLGKIGLKISAKIIQ
ncbi:class I SAM-dependent methyltransferase [Pseudoalteromonas pernae]|uniref:class I SAM-dependent methyltransferase n=1 Tax=Pseudoalteromonas pernae TaxID=3118054 RepID=UPI0032420DD8